jgi:hypothetical protein
MVKMGNKTIDSVAMKSLEIASSELMALISNVIQEFYDNPPEGAELLEPWRTPGPWVTRVLPNLERYHAELQMALRAYQAGDIKPLTLVAAGYAGLSKDIEFDMSWMPDGRRLAVQGAIQRVVIEADRIYRLGYETLTRLEPGDR